MAGPTKAQLIEQNASLREAYDQALEFFQERLAELELALEDVGWQRVFGETDREFSRAGLLTINKLARIYWLKNPLVKRAIYTQTCYVFGQGMTIQADHPLINEVVQAFVDDPKNRSEFFEHQSRMLKETELQLFGNLFFVFFVHPDTGRVRLRSIHPDEIEDIIYNPEDDKDPWYYRRSWTETRINTSTGTPEQKTRQAYYPDWRHHPAGGHPDQIGNIPVEADTPVYHVAVNCLSDMKFGVSEIYAACDWAQAYKNFLEDWATIVKAYSRFAMALTTKGGRKGVASARSKLASTLSTTGAETNPAPVTGSTFIGTEGVKLEPVRTSGATTGMDDARRLMLMVSSATGIFEHYLTGDPSTGNLATAKSMERPMELMFRDRQELWRSVIHEILQFVIDCSARAAKGKIPGRTEKDEYGEENVVLDNDKENDDENLRDKPINRSISITFPPLLEHDVLAMVDAIVNAATLKGAPAAGTLPLKLITRLLLQALEEENIDEILDQLFPDGAGEDLPEPPPRAAPEDEPDVETMMVQAVSELSMALRSMEGGRV